ncbi:hypothetical protein D3C80_797870 [compost metagenome]
MHKRGNVADRTNVDLRTWKERNCAVQIDGETTLDLVEDDAVDALAIGELLLELAPAFFTTCFFARQNSFAECVFDALNVNFNFVARLHRAVFALRAEFLQRYATFDLEASIDDCHVFFDSNDATLYNITFCKVIVGKGFGQQRLEVCEGGIEFRHKYS